MPRQSVRHQSPRQKRTVGRVMHEFKHGELKSGGRRKVRNPRQAIAIALSEAGASRNQSPSQNRRRRARTEQRERKARTAQQRSERRGRSARGGTTFKQLYAQAQKRRIAGRSRMNKAELERALRR